MKVEISKDEALAISFKGTISRDLRAFLFYPEVPTILPIMHYIL
jgi:hypothetical protein